MWPDPIATVGGGRSGATSWAGGRSATTIAGGAASGRGGRSPQLPAVVRGSETFFSPASDEMKGWRVKLGESFRIFTATPYGEKLPRREKILTVPVREAIVALDQWHENRFHRLRMIPHPNVVKWCLQWERFLTPMWWERSDQCDKKDSRINSSVLKPVPEPIDQS